jgi:RNA polymerase sigma-70 factor (ECF subfamily)
MRNSLPGRSAPEDLESDDWLRALRAGTPDREPALHALHHLLLRAALRETERRSSNTPVEGVELRDIAQQAAADALVAILGKLDEFRGQSRFTTWAYKFVILEVSSKLNRHPWRTRSVPFEPEQWDRLPERFGFGPAEAIEQQELLTAVRTAVQDQLTPHQRRVFAALVLNGVPLDVLAAELRTNRNALYKTVFDARRKVRAYLVANGYMEYVERQLRQSGPAEPDPGITAHLAICGPCSEDYHGLRALLS